jgi:TRAP-type C4-dicarboxylate transport system permease small subunit
MTTSTVPAAFMHLLARFNRAMATAAGAAILLMMLAGAADVIGTNFNLIGLRSRPIPSTNEFMATMMVAAMFLGMALAQQRRGHIQVTIGLSWGARFGSWLEAAQHGLHALFYGLIAWFGWSVAAHAFATGEFAAGLIDFPVWPARIALAFGASAMMIQCLVDLLGVFDARFRDPAAPAALPTAH